MRTPRNLVYGMAVVVVSVAGGGVMAASASAGTRTATFVPAADAYVSSGAAGTNFGSIVALWASNSSDTRNSYLRFNVSGLTAPVSKATLRVWAQGASSDGFSLHRVSNTTWSESAITYSNAPSIPNASIAKTGGTAVGYVDVAVTSEITGAGSYSLAMKRSGSKASLAYDSREGAHPPQLVVETTDATAPLVTLTSPAADASTSDSTPDLRGAAGSATGDLGSITVRLYAGGTVSGTPVQTLTTAASNGSWTATASALADGTYTAQAQQSDDHGNVGSSLPRTFSVDAVAPAVSLTSPAAGSQLTTSTPALAGGAGNAAGDGSQVTVSIYSGSSAQGVPVQTRAVSRQGGSWSVTATTLPDGAYVAKAGQSDAAGNQGSSAAVAFTIDAAAPVVSVDSPLPGAVLAEPDPLLAGYAGIAPGDLLNVTLELYAGPQALGLPVRVISAPVGAGGTWSARAGALPDGTWTVRASQDDVAGNHGAGSPVTFTIDTGAPAVAVSLPADGTTVATDRPVLSGTAGDATGDAGSVEVAVY